MTSEAAEIYAAGVEAMGVVLTGFIEWATQHLEDNERNDALHHIVQIANAYRGFTLAIADHEGLEI